MSEFDQQMISSARERFFNLSMDMLCIADFKGNFVDLNPSWMKNLGYSKEEFLTTPYVEFVHPEDKEATIKEASKLSEGLETVYFENRYRHKDGSYKILAWTATSSVDKGLIYAAARDITDYKSTAELERSNEELEQFAYAVSHDLKEPLHVIRTFAKLIKEDQHRKMDDRGKQFLDYIHETANRMNDLITDLLAYSRVGGQEKYEVNSQEVLKLALQNLSESIINSGTKISFKNLPILKANKTQLMQLFQNLVSNAIKFRGSTKPCIHIDCIESSSEFTFFVRDNGIGIDPRYQDQVFQIFQRLNINDQDNGTGIGLSICKKIVKNHGGNIWLESIPGKGSTFYFTIPKTL